MHHARLWLPSVQHRFQNFHKAVNVEGTKTFLVRYQKIFGQPSKKMSLGERKRCSLTIISTIIYNFFNFVSPNVRSLITRNLSYLKIFLLDSFFFVFRILFVDEFKSRVFFCVRTKTTRNQMKLDIPVVSKHLRSPFQSPFQLLTSSPHSRYPHRS